MRRHNSLHGILVSLVTPFTDDRLRQDLLTENIRKLNATPIEGYLVLGGNGEYMSLSDHEQTRVVATVAANRADKLLIGGVACESVQTAVAACCRMAESGADLVRLMPPHYFARLITDEVLTRFYREVADAAPVPILMYNVPRLTGGVRISADTVRRLAEHPNIVGIKDSSGAGLYEFLAATRSIAGFQVLAGTADALFPAMMAGASGGDLSLANYLPHRACDLVRAVGVGELQRARELHDTLCILNRTISGSYGVPGVKAAMDILGFHGGEPRRPLQALAAEDRARIEALLQSRGAM